MSDIYPTIIPCEVCGNFLVEVEELREDHYYEVLLICPVCDKPERQEQSL